MKSFPQLSSSRRCLKPYSSRSNSQKCLENGSVEDFFKQVLKSVIKTNAGGYISHLCSITYTSNVFICLGYRGGSLVSIHQKKKYRDITTLCKIYDCDPLCMCGGLYSTYCHDRDNLFKYGGTQGIISIAKKKRHEQNIPLMLDFGIFFCMCVFGNFGQVERQRSPL